MHGPKSTQVMKARKGTAAAQSLLLAGYPDGYPGIKEVRRRAINPARAIAIVSCRGSCYFSWLPSWTLS